MTEPAQPAAGASLRFPPNFAADLFHKIFEDRAVAGRLEPTGPVAGNLDDYWPLVAAHVDACDYHPYSPYPVLDSSLMIRDTSRVPDMAGALDMVAVDEAGCVRIPPHQALAPVGGLAWAHPIHSVQR